MVWGKRSGLKDALEANGFLNTIQTAFIERVTRGGNLRLPSVGYADPLKRDHPTRYFFAHPPNRVIGSL